MREAIDLIAGMPPKKSSAKTSAHAAAYSMANTGSASPAIAPTLIAPFLTYSSTALWVLAGFSRAVSRNPHLRPFVLSSTKAAKAVGMSKTSILRSIKTGRISAGRDELGQWAIEPCELHRGYPPLTDDTATGNGTEERGVTGPSTRPNGSQRREALTLTGRVRMISRCRQHRPPQSKFQPSCLVPEPFTSIFSIFATRFSNVHHHKRLGGYQGAPNSWIPVRITIF
jgi:hypothetical protein